MGPAQEESVGHMRQKAYVMYFFFGLSRVLFFFFWCTLCMKISDNNFFRRKMSVTCTFFVYLRTLEQNREQRELLNNRHIYGRM